MGGRSRTRCQKWGHLVIPWLGGINSGIRQGAGNDGVVASFASNGKGSHSISIGQIWLNLCTIEEVLHNRKVALSAGQVEGRVPAIILVIDVDWVVLAQGFHCCEISLIRGLAQVLLN